MSPLGKYLAKAVGSGIFESAKGKDVLEIVWRFEHEGKRCEERSLHYFSGGAKPITLALMKHLGWKETDEGLDSINGEAEIEVYEEEYNGKLQRKVRAFAGNGLSQKSKDATKAFLQRLTQSQTDDDLPPEAHAAARQRQPGEDDIGF